MLIIQLSKASNEGTFLKVLCKETNLSEVPLGEKKPFLCHGWEESREAVDRGFPGNWQLSGRMQLSDNLQPTADNSPRDYLLLQITSTAFPTVGEPLMSIAVELGASMLLSSSKQRKGKGEHFTSNAQKREGENPCSSLYMP